MSSCILPLLAGRIVFIVLVYRTLHSYHLIWTVCHLLLRHRWRMHTYSVPGNHWPGEPRVLLKAMSARKFRPPFGATSKIRIFYKYVVIKHTFSLSTQILRSGNTLPPVWLNRRQIATTGIPYVYSIQSRYHFSLPSFAIYFWFISSSLFNLFCYIFFSSQDFPAFSLCVIIFACCRRFLLCVSSWIRYSGFEYLFVFFRGTPIMSQINFTTVRDGFRWDMC